MNAPRDWDVPAYERVAAPIQALGHRLLEDLELRGDETVLDAGCGSGEVTANLLDRLPRGQVIAVDGSPAMTAKARERLDPARAHVVDSDLCELDLDQAVDVVFSNATFHWIADHDRLFERLHAALRPGGRLLAQCGGEGNVATAVAAIATASCDPRFAPHLAGWDGPWNFSSPRAAEQRLERAGFVNVRSGLHTVGVTPEDPAEYYATMIAGPHLDRLPKALRPAFMDAVLAGLPRSPTLRYVRLTLTARRTG